MKKLFLFVAVATLAISLNSCSSSDSGGSSSKGTVTAKVDGVAKTFKVASVVEEVINPGTEDEYTELNFTGKIGTTETITFSFLKGVTGDTAYGSGDFSYTRNGVYYFDDGTSTFNVTTNSIASKSLIGAFSGRYTDGTNEIFFTEGTFNIQY